MYMIYSSKGHSNLSKYVFKREIMYTGEQGNTLFIYIPGDPFPSPRYATTHGSLMVIQNFTYSSKRYCYKTRLYHH